jgi:hypothetical protein
MTDSLEKLIYKLKPARQGFLRMLGTEHIIATDTNNSAALLNALMHLPVSRLSVLKHQTWDFNDEPGTLARDIQGSKSRIDFDNYKYLNSTILFELKVAMLCVLTMPGALRLSDTSSTSKPHTVLDCFKSLIPFYDQMCARKRREQGDEFFELSYYSLADFSESDYRIQAKEFDRAFRVTTNIGFRILRSHFLFENLFEKALPYLEMDSLGWVQNSIINPNVSKKKKWFSNQIFEKCSRNATFAVVDFLTALNEPVRDTDALERIGVYNYDKAAQVGLTRRSFDIYVAIRMTSRGYTGAEIEPHLYTSDPAYWSERRPGFLLDKEAICRFTETKLNDNFYAYITHVSNSANYIVAQYTGMRPSELCGVMAEGCLTTSEFGHDLILSTVIKSREAYGKLFSDKWAAIPIVQDAVRALRILNRFKRNPYLIANMNTVTNEQANTANSLSGSGLGHQLAAYLAEVLTQEELDSLDFSPCTLRHSLANQMYRAAVGLPFISYQLKHFGNMAGAIGQNRLSATTIDYGGIGDLLTSSDGRNSGNGNLRLKHDAEVEFVKNACDPDGSFVGENADAHRERLVNYFKGYLEEGYTKEEIFDRMVEIGFAVINVGQGFCYGDAVDESDPALPCIGSLRCNPNHCKNAVVTKANAPKWREVYVQNSIALKKLQTNFGTSQVEGTVDSGFARSMAQMKLAMAEAEAVLKGLNEEVLL